MRLTLRTLLAYLDNTLDAQDAEALRAKLADSGFATQLVQRIRDSLGNPNLAAPSPDAVGPIEDANSISEYLDSTLSAEQIAEIERACLESDPHLAEAAACHQILTMVLGKPANVPPELRKRIYELPDRQLDQLASGANYSSLSVPVEPIIVDSDSPNLETDSSLGRSDRIAPSAAAGSDNIPTADATVQPPSSAVKPVSVGDSGVSDAPTRLREIESSDGPRSAAPTIGNADPTMAGSRPRRLADADIYGGSIRPSRIAPWLVSLGVAAALLLALSQIFAPFISRDQQVADGEIVAAPEDTAAGTIGAAGESLPENGETTGPDQSDEESESTSTETRQDETVASGASESVAPEPTDAASPMPAVPASSSADAPELAPAASDVAVEDPPSPEPTEPVTSESENAAVDDRTESGQPEVPPPSPTADNAGVVNSVPAEAEMNDPERPAAQPPAPQPPAEASEPKQVGKVISRDALLATLENDDWMELRQGAPVLSGSTLVCAPTFRAEIASDDEVTTTLIGPATVSWRSDPTTADVIVIDNGRVLISPSEDRLEVDLVIAAQPIQIKFSESSHRAAIEVSHWRDPGLDPLIPENHAPIRSIYALQGSLSVSGVGDQTIESSQQWIMYDNQQPTVTDSGFQPNWVEAPSASAENLEANARNGLMELLAEGGQSLETALREATSFRRSEVAALAAQSLLVFGRGDVYFDGVGILNQPKQRAYWLDHYSALQNQIDQNVESAAKLHDSISRTDSAHGDSIIRLLTGYSQQQLTDGGDEELVSQLDSSSMAVRVLAIENLRQIVGTTLYYRADQENAVRREPNIKKWIARQRIGGIRWPE